MADVQCSIVIRDKSLPHYRPIHFSCLFGTIRNEDSWTRWGNDIWRVDAALGYRFTDYLQVKLQYSFSRQDSLREGEHLFAGQLTAKF